MPRKSYREHRAERTAALSDDGTDLDSLASFSTFASHTTLASHTGFPSFGSRASSSFANGRPNPYYNSSLGLAPPSLRQRTYSNISTTSKRDATVDNISIPTSPSMTSRILSPPPSDVPTPSGLPPSPAPPPSREEGRGESTDRERERNKEKDKRRRRARNEERWRRARAREAAHDAPVRRAAKALHSTLGSGGTQAAAFVVAITIRVFITIAMLSTDSTTRTSLAREAGAIRLACGGRVAPLLRPLVPTCRAVFGTLGSDPSTSPDGTSLAWPGTKAAAAVIGLRLLAESLLWSAAVVWSTVEGWREGRTLRTKVAAIVYLTLAPALAIREATLLPVRGALGFAAWALVSTTSGYDAAAAAFMTASVWFEASTRVYVPAFAVYAVGKHVWFGGRGRGYIGRLVFVVLATLFVLGGMEPVPLRERLLSVLATARSTGAGRLFRSFLVWLGSLVSIRNALSTIALVPTTYLTLKSSYTLRPRPQDPVTPDAVPATARLLPIALTATAGALALWPCDPSIPLLPLAFASALRRDDDEWAVAVQMQHVAAMSLWPKLSGPTLSLAGGYVLGWNMLIGAGQDAPSPFIQGHQKITLLLNVLVSVCPLFFARFHFASLDWSRITPYVWFAHSAFIVTSVAAVAVWANIRLVKTAWAVGAL